MAFAALKKLAITAERTATLTLDDIDLGAGPPTLELRFAGEANKPYWRAILRQANDARGTASRKVTEASLATSRLSDVQLFSEHIVAGWTGIVDGDEGALKPVSLSPAKAVEFFEALLANDGSDIWNRIFAFASNRDNFRDAPTTTGVDLGKP